MCRYKPCSLWIIVHVLLDTVMVFFCVSMFMFVGGTYPSARFRNTWKWSIVHYMGSVFISLFKSLLIYKEVVAISRNRGSFIISGLFVTGATSLCATIWPPITKLEFREFINEGFRVRRDVPVFVEWLQFTQGCCGVDNYTDYINYSGTRLVIDRVDINQDVNEINTKARPNSEVLNSVVFDVPRSCCALNTRQNRACGLGIPYTTDIEIVHRVNSLTKGCYKTFYDMIYNQDPAQIAMFYVVFRTYPIIDALLHTIGLCVHFYYYNNVLHYMHAPDDPVFHGGIKL